MCIFCTFWTCVIVRVGEHLPRSVRLSQWRMSLLEVSVGWGSRREQAGLVLKPCAVGGWEGAGWIYCWCSMQQQSERLLLRAGEKPAVWATFPFLHLCLPQLSFSLMLLYYHTNDNVFFFYKPMRLVFAFFFFFFCFWVKKEESYFSTSSPWNRLI